VFYFVQLYLLISTWTCAELPCRHMLLGICYSVAYGELLCEPMVFDMSRESAPWTSSIWVL